MKHKVHQFTYWNVYLAFALFAVASPSFGQTNFSISSPPDWVRVVEWAAPTQWARSEQSEGTHYVLYERQENPRLEESFTRIILLMENETGVQDSGSLMIDFDPNLLELFLPMMVMEVSI